MSTSAIGRQPQSAKHLQIVAGLNPRVSSPSAHLSLTSLKGVAGVTGGDRFVAEAAGDYLSVSR